MPSLTELDYLFRTLRSFSDEIIGIQYEKSIDFFNFMRSKHGHEVFVKYVGRMIDKIKQTKFGLQNSKGGGNGMMLDLNDILGGGS